MICKECAKFAAWNREVFDSNQEKIGTKYELLTKPFFKHPKKCGCPCMHKMPTQWEDSFSCERPE